jgi:hypothetical protein
MPKVTLSINCYSVVNSYNLPEQTFFNRKEAEEYVLKLNNGCYSWCTQAEIVIPHQCLFAFKDVFEVIKINNDYQTSLPDETSSL